MTKPTAPHQVPQDAPALAYTPAGFPRESLRKPKRKFCACGFSTASPLSVREKWRVPVTEAGRLSHAHPTALLGRHSPASASGQHQRAAQNRLLLVQPARKMKKLQRHVGCPSPAATNMEAPLGAGRLPSLVERSEEHCPSLQRLPAPSCQSHSRQEGRKALWWGGGRGGPISTTESPAPAPVYTKGQRGRTAPRTWLRAGPHHRLCWRRSRRWCSVLLRKAVLEHAEDLSQQ